MQRDKQQFFKDRNLYYATFPHPRTRAEKTAWKYAVTGKTPSPQQVAKAQKEEMERRMKEGREGGRKARDSMNMNKPFLS